MSNHPADASPRLATDIVLTSDAATLATRASKLADLGTRLNRVLPSELSAQVKLANLRERKLVFFAASPAWATRLRYLQGLVLEAARQLGVPADGMIVKVRNAGETAAAAQPEPTPLSETAARHLALAARLLDRS
jgi:hypothetical protein